MGLSRFRPSVWSRGCALLYSRLLPVGCLFERCEVKVSKCERRRSRVSVTWWPWWPRVAMFHSSSARPTYLAPRNPVTTNPLFWRSLDSHLPPTHHRPSSSHSSKRNACTQGRAEGFSEKQLELKLEFGLASAQKGSN